MFCRAQVDHQSLPGRPGEEANCEQSTGEATYVRTVAASSPTLLNIHCIYPFATHLVWYICTLSADLIRHVFTVTVSGVRGLSVFNNTVWGEADCFVQYHFPCPTSLPQSEEEGEGEGQSTLSVPEISLQPVRTDMTLCVPNPAFSHEVCHTLPLPPGHLVQREVLRTCGGSGGVEFELWRRFYYPNIRDQLIAKARHHLLCTRELLINTHSPK